MREDVRDQEQEEIELKCVVNVCYGVSSRNLRRSQLLRTAVAKRMSHPYDNLVVERTPCGVNGNISVVMQRERLRVSVVDDIFVVEESLIVSFSS